MFVEGVLIGISLVWLFLAAVIDIRFHEVPNLLTYSLIVFGLGLRLLSSLITQEWAFFIYGLIGFGAMYLVGTLFYYTQQWGGGDAKLLMGLGAAFGSAPSYINPSYLPYLVTFFAWIAK